MPAKKKPAKETPSKKTTRKLSAPEPLIDPEVEEAPDVTPEKDVVDEKVAARKANLARVMAIIDKAPIYYDIAQKFWFKPANRYLQMVPARIKQHLIKRGLSDERWIDGLKESEWVFSFCEESPNRTIDYAGPIAGRRVGLYSDGGKQYLVTDEANGIWDALPEIESEPKIFAPFVRTLLPEEQWRRFCYWLAIGLRSLRNQEFKPGHAVFLAGPAGCGKSFLQLIVKHVLGGRSANPFPYMFGETQFNEELIGSEVWSFEDPPSHSDWQTRMEFGERLKDCCNTDTFRCRGLHKTALDLRLARRIIASINNQPEHLQRVPPLIDGTEDKVFLFKCSDARGTLADFTVTEEQKVFDIFGEAIPVGQQDRARLLREILAEIPAIRAWLLAQFKNVPPEWVGGDTRAGIRSWQHPELLAVINDLAPEAHILVLIDQYLWEKHDAFQGPLVGRAYEIDKLLREKTPGGDYARICKNPMALGKYLGRLRHSCGQRISSRTRTGGIEEYIITPPQEAISEPNERE